VGTRLERTRPVSDTRLVPTGHGRSAGRGLPMSVCATETCPAPPRPVSDTGRGPLGQPARPQVLRLLELGGVRAMALGAGGFEHGGKPLQAAVREVDAHLRAG